MNRNFEPCPHVLRRPKSVQSNCLSFAEHTVSSCSSLYDCDDHFGTPWSNQNQKFSDSPMKMSSRFFQKEMRRKKKTFKELMANFWVPPSNSAHLSLKENHNQKSLPRRRSSTDSFGTFHPIDISSLSNRSAGTIANIRSSVSQKVAPVQPSRTSMDMGGDLLTPNPVPSIFVSPPSSSNNSVYSNDESSTNSIINAAAEVVSDVSFGLGRAHYPIESDSNNTDYMNEGVKPGPYDIVCGRNSGAYNYIGNRRFRVTIEMSLQRYIDSPTREDKTKVIKSIVWMLHNDVGARFLKKETIKSSSGKKRMARFSVMTDKQAREKVGHALRDLVIAARKERQQKERVLPHEQMDK